MVEELVNPLSLGKFSIQSCFFPKLILLEMKDDAMPHPQTHLYCVCGWGGRVEKNKGDRSSTSICFILAHSAAIFFLIVIKTLNLLELPSSWL